MRRVLTQWRVAFYLAAIFCAGAVSGWVTMAKTTRNKMLEPPRSDEIADAWRDRLSHHLNLTPQQAREIDLVVEEHSREIHSIHGQWIKRVREAISNRNTQITAILNPEQQARFEQLEKEQREAWRSKDSRRRRDDWRGKGRGRPSGPPPPPPPGPPDDHADPCPPDE